MSILDRLNLLVRSNLNSSLGRHGSRSGRSALAEVESSLREARREQAKLRRGEAQLIAGIRTARDKADQWEDRAMLALRNGDEDLAREALRVKNEAMREAGRLREELDDHRSHIQDLERALEALEHKLEGTKSRLRAASQDQRRSSSTGSRRLSGGVDESKWEEEFRRRAKARGQGPSDGPRPVDPEINPTFDTSRKFSEMDRMASKIDGMEAEIEAMRELSDIGGDGRAAELESIFRSLEGRGRPKKSRGRDERKRSDEPPIDDDLADLKKKFE